MKNLAALSQVFLFGAALLATYVLVPIGFNRSWEGTLQILPVSVLLVIGPIAFLVYSVFCLITTLKAAGRPIDATALEPETVYIVESVTVRRGAGHLVASLAVLKKAVLETGEVDTLTDRLLVFFHGKELHEGERVMGVTRKFFSTFSKSGATSQGTTLVLLKE